jgi:tetratricopeptide (TPR) repeat protein
MTSRRFEAGARLVSVLGISGTGKTRLAQRFGWTRLGDFPGGVWFCDVSQARGLLDWSTLAQGLEVPLGKGEPVAQLGGALAGRGECLVIIDNFEQVSSLAERTVGYWLDRAREVHFIVTTREVLGIVGEEALALAPLPPADGVALFLQRAVAAASDFRPTSEDEAAIDPLVRLLDGLPLAIELAAARVRVMPPRTLLARMSERFKLLASGGVTHRPAGDLARCFRLVVGTLVGGGEGGAGAAVGIRGRLHARRGGSGDRRAGRQRDSYRNGPRAVARAEVTRATGRRSPLRPTSQRPGVCGGPSAIRGTLSGQWPVAMSAARARHWRHFAELDERAAVADGCIEIDNLAAACRRAAGSGDAKAAVGALCGAWAALKLCGPFRGAVELTQIVDRVSGLGSAERAIVDWVAGSAMYMLGQGEEARPRFDAGLKAAQAVQDRRSEALLLCALADQLTTEGQTEEAHSRLVRALTLARELDSPALECKALNGLGALFNDLGHLDQARAHYDAALSLARSLGDRRWRVDCSTISAFSITARVISMRRGRFMNNRSRLRARPATDAGKETRDATSVSYIMSRGVMTKRARSSKRRSPWRDNSATPGSSAPSSAT